MTPFFDIALAVVSTAATLAAFGGKTTNDLLEQPLRRRITPRGWVSLYCLFLTLCLGVTKIYSTSHEENEKKQLEQEIKARDAAEAQTRQAVLKQQLAEANAKADAASIRLQSLETIDNTNLARLGETKAALADVRNILDITRNDMSQQSAATLVTSLANSNQNARDVWIYIPLIKSNKPAQSITHALFPGFNQDVCTDLVGMNLELNLYGGGESESMTFERSDSSRSHRYLAGDIQKYDELTAFNNIDTDDVNSFMELMQEKSSPASEMYAAGFHDANGQSISAAQLFSSLTRTGRAGVALTMDWPRIFKNKKSYENLQSKYPEILTAAWNGDPDKSGEYAASKNHPFPEQCKIQAQEYFRKNFTKALVMIYLDQKPHELIIVPLKALPVKVLDEYVILPFDLLTTPAFSTASESQLNSLDDLWRLKP